MLKPFSLIFFILVMVWCGAILITSDAQKRIDRTCLPVEYADVGATAAMSLIDQGWGEGTHTFFARMHYGCRYVVWSMFYEKDWERYQRESAPAAAGGPVPSSAASTASSSVATKQPSSSASAPIAAKKIAAH